MNIGLLSEVEHVNTLKIDDATLSILFAVAQEESATKSENIKFGIHQRMREGKALLNHTRFFRLYQGCRRATCNCARRS